MTDEQLTELIREREASSRLAPPPAVWERVEQCLGPPAVRPRAELRVLRTSLSVAASLAALLVVAWLLWPSQRSATSAEAPVAAELEDVELEAAPPPRVILNRETYEGVRIEEGIIGRDELRSCVAC